MTEQSVVEAYLPLQPSTSRVIDRIDQSLDVGELSKALTRFHFARPRRCMELRLDGSTSSSSKRSSGGAVAPGSSRGRPPQPPHGIEPLREVCSPGQRPASSTPLVRQRADGGDAGLV